MLYVPPRGHRFESFPGRQRWQGTELRFSIRGRRHLYGVGSTPAGSSRSSSSKTHSRPPCQGASRRDVATGFHRHVPAATPRLQPGRCSLERPAYIASDRLAPLPTTRSKIENSRNERDGAASRSAARPRIGCWERLVRYAVPTTAGRGPGAGASGYPTPPTSPLIHFDILFRRGKDRPSRSDHRTATEAGAADRGGLRPGVGTEVSPAGKKGRELCGERGISPRGAGLAKQLMVPGHRPSAQPSRVDRPALSTGASSTNCVA